MLAFCDLVEDKGAGKLKRKALFKIRTAAACLALSAVFLSGCTFPFGQQTEIEEEEDNSINVEVSNPVIKDVSNRSNFSATVVAESEVRVIPLVTGEVIEKNYEVGDHVNEGDLLFKIDDEPYQIAVKRAEASVTSAQAGLTSAQASLNKSEADANTTRAQAIQNVGEIPYNEQRKDYNVDSAYVAKRQANNALKNAGDDVDLAKHSLDDLRDARDAAESAMNSAKAAYEAADEETRSAKYDLYQSAKKAYETADSNVETAKTNLDKLRRQEDNAEMNYVLNGESYSLAEVDRYNYNTYGKATTIYGSYASAVGADSSVTSSKANVTSSAANVKSAQAGLEDAQLNLEHTSVKAPVSGIITAINVTEHNMATQQEASYVIQSDEPCKVVFYVAEETAKSIRPGTESVVTKNGTEYTAKIITVYDTIDSSTGLFKVEASVVGQGAENLIAGSSVSIETITRRSDRTLTVPIDSVYYDGDKAYLYVAEGGRAKKVYVTTGLSDDLSLEITEGIGPEDKVIVTWNGSMRDGSELNIKDASGSSGESGDPSGGATPSDESRKGNDAEADSKVMEPVTEGSSDYSAGAGDIE